MVQKRTKGRDNVNVELEIVLNLLRKRDNHVRGIAKDLGTSHTTVLRKTAGLVKANVLDYKKEGKNSIFSLKRTLKARNYVYMAENYKLISVMEKYTELGIIMNDILASTASDSIVLFGSYANFTAKSDSDIDLFVETKDRRLKEKLNQIDSRISLKIGSFDLNNSLIREIMKNHAIIKGIEAFYDKTKLFEQT